MHKAQSCPEGTQLRLAPCASPIWKCYPLKAILSKNKSGKPSFTSSLYETGGLLSMCHLLQNSAWCSPNNSHMESFACQVLLVLLLKQKISGILKVISVLKLTSAGLTVTTRLSGRRHPTKCNVPALYLRSLANKMFSTLVPVTPSKNLPFSTWTEASQYHWGADDGHSDIQQKIIQNYSKPGTNTTNFNPEGATDALQNQKGTGSASIGRKGSGTDSRGARV